MSISEVTHSITSFASLILNAGRIRQIQDDTGRQFIGKSVIETQPNGSQLEAVIHIIEWQPTVGLDGDWLLYIEYTNHPAKNVGAWVGREVLTLKEGQ